MAAVALLDDSCRQIADSLTIDAVPFKLRCGACNRIAVDALKLPCCDQCICESCSRRLPETCPICSHSPISAADCTPNRNLRLTIRAFLKNEEKKRNKDVEPPVTQATEKAAPPETAAVPQSVDAVEEPAPVGTPVEQLVAGDGGDTSQHQEVAEDNAAVAVSHNDGEDDDDDGYEEDEDDNVVITTERPDDELPHNESHEDLPYANGQREDGGKEQQQFHQQQGYGYGPSQNQGGFGNMDFNSMPNFQSMMGMGMPNFGMGMPNMMGMPGMNMDPSMMFGGGGGFGGMGDMSGMMNMGMNGMGGGGFGGMPGMGGMNGGFFPPNGNGGGYNSNQQQNFGMMTPTPFHHQNHRGFGGRGMYSNNNARGGGFGRGNRGFGGRGGRGGWQNYGQQNQYQQQQPYQQQHHQQQHHGTPANEDYMDGVGSNPGTGRGSPTYEPMKASDPDADNARTASASVERGAEGATNTDREVNGSTDVAGNAANDEHVDAGEDGSALKAGGDRNGIEDGTVDGEFGDAAAEGSQSVAHVVVDTYGDQATFDSAPYDGYNEQYQQDYAYGARGRGGFQGGMRGFGGRAGGAYGYVATPAEPARASTPPINAPTGPKAMRAGLPNSGRYSRPQQQQVHASTLASSVEPERPRTAGRDEPADSRSYSADRKHRSRSRSRSKRRDEDDDSYSRDRHRSRRSHKSKDDRDEEYSGRESDRKVRSRNESRDEGHSKRRHRDRDDEHHSSRSQRDRSKERRKHRHRSRSPRRDKSTDRDESKRHKSKRREDEYYDESSDRAKDRSRKHSRRDDDRYESKDRSSSHRHSSRRESTADDRHRDRSGRESKSRREEPQEEEFEFKIKGKSATLKQQHQKQDAMRPPTTIQSTTSDRRRSSALHSPATPATTSADPYAADREKARKEREDIERRRVEGRRQSSGHNSFNPSSKRGANDDFDEGEREIPTGPRGDGDGSKRVKRDSRRHAARFEGEVLEDGGWGR
ncbi:hypothetical protein BDY17DRAFT_299358 [Neohortaea acidophila]|uniref:RING-type domain-containing protein n=1 Tax=Neohortaea acidophila TaxID=245834 RepID=A0A6A6PNZ3_9PEZI|nr:uncharacterized protein BDY17DRAFT_299358 [Neohortaea acidophila]KAF2481625.1 hypothetical protein BDY17DRAFT_299358 [Neohortaea acidophila]